MTTGFLNSNCGKSYDQIFPYFELFGFILTIKATNYLHYGVHEECNNPNCVQWHYETHTVALRLCFMNWSGSKWWSQSRNRSWLLLFFENEKKMNGTINFYSILFSLIFLKKFKNSSSIPTVGTRRVNVYVLLITKIRRLSIPDSSRFECHWVELFEKKRSNEWTLSSR